MTNGLRPYPEYQESGVAWLGNIPAHWRLERAKWLFRKMDRPVRPGDDVVTCFRDGTVTLRKNRRLRGYTEALHEIGYQGVRRGDLVIHAMDAFAGAVGVSDSDGKGTPVYAVCEPLGGTNGHYFAHVTREMARSQWIAALAKGIRERSTDFRFDGFATQRVPVPPTAEQGTIARYLAAADRRIRRYIHAKQRLITLLEEQKRRIVHRAVTRGLDPDVPLKPSGVEWLGHVPAHWQVTPLKRRWAVIDCKHLTVPFVDDGVPLASVREVQQFDLRLGTAKRTSEAWYSHLVSGNRKPRRGDLIYCRNVSVGACAYVGTDARFAMGQDVCLIRSESESGRFLNYYMHSPAMSRQLTAVMVGSTFDRINVEEVKSLTVVVPPREEQATIVAALDARTLRFDGPMRAARRDIALMMEYRTRLIADVVTGKLDVRAAAAELPNDSDRPDIVLLDRGELLDEDEVENAVDVEPAEV